MSSCAPFDIPTLEDLGVNPTVLEELSPVVEANKWLSEFSASVRDRATGSITDLFHQFGFWKDILALTWNFRTIRGLCLAEDSLLVFLRLCFEFETKQGQGKAIAFLVPTPDTQWKAWSLLTRLESLKGFPERFLTDGSPTVLIIGAGHTGLDIAARLKYMDVSVLVIDRSARIGDNLCLHDTVWFNQMPYLPFPSTWPVFCPAAKDWLEFYAKALELNVWLSSRVVKTSWNENAKTWNNEPVKHLVFATGYGGGFPKVPDIPRKGNGFHGILRPNNFTVEYSRKKVVVVGAANSALDIAMDPVRHNAEVTLNQRSSTYVISLDASISSLQGYSKRYNEHSSVEFSDLLSSALPWPSLLPLLRAETTHAASVDKGVPRSIIRGLESAGFRTNLGIDDGGVLPLIYARGGGLYVDTGASGEIIKGNIKIKSGCSIQRFTSVGLEFDDGSEMGCDVVIFATGYGESRDSIREVCGSEIAKQVGPIWGLDNEGELQGVWRRTGQPHLWIGMGT
ncbi:hypothetical protein EDD16DRAFT_1698444 [Pisolithus croceorrhizus]|nr:hypothetical protein EDD16DRAFT_1698444 [Pisolithus croceorrhizus]